jgi:hypothetical protein
MHATPRPAPYEPLAASSEAVLFHPTAASTPSHSIPLYAAEPRRPTHRHFSLHQSCPSTPQVEAALADARRAETKQQLDAQLLPAVMAFAQRKQAGSVHLQQQRFAEAAAEYRGALKAMAELLEKLPAADANPLRDQLVRLQRAMEGELAQAVRALPQTGEGAALPASHLE